MTSYISIVRLQPVVFYIILCCSALTFYTLYSILYICSWENLHLILHQVSMITISQIKIVIYKSDDKHGMIMTFKRLHWSFCCNFINELNPSYYAGIMLDAFNNLLCSNLCWSGSLSGSSLQSCLCSAGLDLVLK